MEAPPQKRSVTLFVEAHLLLPALLLWAAQRHCSKHADSYVCVGAWEHEKERSVDVQGRSTTVAMFCQL